MLARKLGGRFAGNSSEAYQRQLTAPVHKWKKAWVSPTGLQPESSYKICKWVRIDTAEDGTPAPDEDEELEEGEEGEENEGEEGEAGDGAEEGDAVEAAEAGEAGEAAVTPAVQAVEAGEAAVLSAVGDAKSTDTTETPLAGEAAPSAPTPAPETAPTAPVTHDIPSNAIEISNTAPGSTEQGHGELAGSGGIDITHGEAPETVSEDKGMEVDMAEEGKAEEGKAPEVDKGLVMGDLEPERKEFVVEGEEKPREMDDQ